MPQTNIDATTGDRLQLDAENDGPALQREGAGLSARDQDDTTYVNVKAADALVDDDLATLRQRRERTVRLVGTTQALATTDEVVIQTSGASITLTLPAATGTGAIRTIKKATTTASGDLTIDGNGADTIDGGATAVLKRQYESVDLVDYATGTWSIV